MQQAMALMRVVRAVGLGGGIAMMAVAPALAADVAGVYRGFLAFDFKGKEVKEALMISFDDDGILIMGAEEGQDEPVDPETGIVTKNDFEAANLGVWRSTEDGMVEFGSQQYRAGSPICGAIKEQTAGVLPACSFIFSARLQQDVEVRGQTCDLGGTGGGLTVQSVDTKTTVTDPFNLGLSLDYCLTKLTVDDFFKLAPLKQ